ncbi:hypothetical protein [Nocardia sp. SC052]|uniref:hypothetical protein n=1 Tax=Nocardia sichangensis TaxID=3385975 RepID=UPI0039A2B3CB
MERIRHEDLDRTRKYLATSSILARPRRWCAQHRPDAVAVVVVWPPAHLGYTEADLTGENTIKIYARHGIDPNTIRELRF